MVRAAERAEVRRGVGAVGREYSGAAVEGERVGDKLVRGWGRGWGWGWGWGKGLFRARIRVSGQGQWSGSGCSLRLTLPSSLTCAAKASAPRHA